MKRILLILLSLLMLACTNNNTSVDESKEAQVSRLLKEADKKKEEIKEALKDFNIKYVYQEELLRNR
mgnify:FL=1